MRILVIPEKRGKHMAKTIFGTTEKSNFILNMDLDSYRSACAKLLLIVIWATAGAMAINQLTYGINGQLANMIGQGGSDLVIGLILVGLRSVATLFSVGGVAAMICTFIGIMRKQATKTTLIPYCIIIALLAWGVASICHSFDTTQSLFGIDGRDEGWIALVMYATMFYTGTMLRRPEQKFRFLDGLMIFGIANCAWGLLQSQSILDFPNQYRMIEPMLRQNVSLPSGFTDSPVTFGMLLAMLICLAVPAAMFGETKKRRIIALVCAGGCMLLSFKTQVYAGWIAGAGGLLLTMVLLTVRYRDVIGRRFLVPAVVCGAAVLSLTWTFFSPSLNQTYFTASNEPIENGFSLVDGGIVWDDGYYRLSCAGPYSSIKEHDFDINDSNSVLRYAWSEGLRVAKKYPVFGTGPDNFSFTQLHESLDLMSNPNTIDRPYNDYLFVAATRGWISLVLYAGLIIVCLYLGWKQRRQVGWVTIGMICAAVLYALAAMVGVSVLTVAPVWWVVLGMLAASPMKPQQKKEEKKAT